MKRFSSLYRYKRKIRHLYFKIYEHLFFNFANIEKSEAKKFVTTNLSFKDGLKKLNLVLKEINNGSFNRKIDSVHWLLFSCLSVSNKKIVRILEIGTAGGMGTHILSKLFPASEIITVDLPDDDPLSRSFYGRMKKGKHASYLERQRRNTKARNIQFVKTNSFFLLDKVRGSFDLIWIDGGHLYPDVAWDICNAWQLCNEGGGDHD